MTTITAPMLGPVAEPAPAAVSLFIPADTSDEQLVELWLHGKSPHTQRAYRADAERFLRFVARPLRMVTLVDLQAYADSLAGAPATRIRALAAVKSLLTFGQRTGFLVLNVGAALKLPPRKDTLAERILDEAEVHTLLAREPGHRNRVLLRLLYRAGLRVSEIASLCWRDLQTRDDGGQVTVFGKGGKTRTVLGRPTSGATWCRCAAMLAWRARSSARAAAATSIHRQSSASCATLPSAPSSRPARKCRRTGCGMRTPPTPSSAVHRSTWSRPHSDTPAWQRLAAISMRGRPTVRRAIRRVDD